MRINTGAGKHVELKGMTNVGPAAWNQGGSSRKLFADHHHHKHHLVRIDHDERIKAFAQSATTTDTGDESLLTAEEGLNRKPLMPSLLSSLCSIFFFSRSS